MRYPTLLLDIRDQIAVITLNRPDRLNAWNDQMAGDLMLTGRMISGRELAALGLASAALPADRVLPEAIARAREILKAAPVSVAMSKRLLWEGLTTPVETMLRREIPLFFHAAEQPDAVEGFTSFLEKRDPAWKLKASKDMPDM